MSSFKTSKVWFGIVTNQTNMSFTYRKLLDDMKSSYCIVGKVRDNNDQIILIKFLMIFDYEVDFFSLTDRYNDKYYNTIVPLYNNVQEHISLIKKITYIESGVDPETNDIIEDERYFSSDDSAFSSPSTSDDESEEDDDEEEKEEEEDEQEEPHEKQNTGCSTWFKMYALTTIVILIFMNYYVDDDYKKKINDLINDMQ